MKATFFTALLTALMLFITHGRGAPPVQELSDGELRELIAAEFKEEQDKLRALAASTEQKDRLMAVTGLDSYFMDYDLLFQLMNDTDMRVRTTAIETLRYYFCTFEGPRRPLPTELARKMATMLEKEVTQQRIDEAFASGEVKVSEGCLVIGSALTLNHLYGFRDFTGAAHDYAVWQGRVLQPLVTALVRRSKELQGSMAYSQNELLRVITDPETLLKTMRVVVTGLEDESLRAFFLEETLRSLRVHPLLGKNRPMELMLLAEIGPHLESLKQRIQTSPELAESAERLCHEITKSLLAAREKLGPPPGGSAGKK